MSSKPRSPASPANRDSKSSPVSKKPKVAVNVAYYKRRLDNELRYIKSHHKDKILYKVLSVEAEGRRWTVLFLPDKPPFNAGAYRLLVDFPAEYPFRAPSVMFVTRLHHPNVGEKGNVELPILIAEAWKPTIRVVHVFDAIASLLNYPQVATAIRKDIAEQMVKNKADFFKEATAVAKNHSEVRT
uniref:UBC core domain-containing protein n=1 Tax=Panagrellus redivivus TaxID=6233 RepID=A0A7E4VNA6_PANRE